MTYAIRTNNWKKYTRTKCKGLIGALIIGEDGKEMNGEHRMYDNTLIRFKNGFVDGDGQPAIEYAEDGTEEYWTKGKPNGCPAIITDYGATEEDWIGGEMIELRSEFEIENME